MGLLAPLYALAALAIAGPIVLHLIRRQPRGRTEFSSLMFLQPSPPTVTRRSRLENLPLLLLRILAICLIALAFARPYLRQQSLVNAGLEGRSVVLLIDTSASMLRAGIWEGVQREASKFLDGLSSEDRVSLYTIDRRLEALVSLDAALEQTPAQAMKLVRSELDRLSPSFHATELALGLTAVSDMLEAARVEGSLSASRAGEIVLFSDLHLESGLESLQGYVWPKAVVLDVRRVQPNLPGNARVAAVGSADSDAETQFRVRVENDIDSLAQTFDLLWADAENATIGTATRIQVPAGQVRTIPLVEKPPGADRVLLQGDAWELDNVVLEPAVEPGLEIVAYVGPIGESPSDDPAFFLKQAPLSSPSVNREVVTPVAEDVAATIRDSSVKMLFIEPSSAVLEESDALIDLASRGATVVLVLARPTTETSTENTLAEKIGAELLACPELKIREADVNQFALMGSVDYKHPVFRPFADPRFNDFSKLRIWSHRSLKLPKDRADLRVVAGFDNGDSMLVQRRVDAGSVWVLTCGWQPSGSGLGLSSKFVPILLGMLDPESRGQQDAVRYEVGETIALTAEELSELTIERAGGEFVETSVESGIAEQLSNGVVFSEPGIYSLITPDDERTVAIQLPASESRSAAQSIDVFDQYGVPIGEVASDTELVENARQMQVAELEGNQRLWQFLLAGCILVLAVETFAAAWLTRKPE